MILDFIPKEPDAAYIANKLWLPKSGVRVGPIKKALEFEAQGVGGQQRIRLWEESTHHVICPREFLPPSQYPNYKFPFIDTRPHFQKVKFKDLVVPRNEEQVKAWDSLSKNHNGILNLGCGKGKTKLALKKIAQRGTPTLVIVPDGGILDQWKKSIYGDDRTPAGLEFDGDLGIIQGPVFQWAKPVTLALVTTLGLRIRDGSMPEELFRYFGLVVYDEVHQIGAPMFSLTAAPFYGDRIGLTATVRREDGLDPIFRYHIGEPFYSDLSQDLIPRIYFQQTPAKLDYNNAVGANGMINMSLLRTMLGRDPGGNVYRYWSIVDALQQGRKILCLSHSKDQLRLFHAMFPGSGLIVEETPKAERLSVLRNSQICFAIARLGSTGVDDDRLDTLFWLTPFRSKISLQQSMGRIQRQLEGKKTPVMVVFEDWLTPSLRKLCLALKQNLREWDFEMDTLKPANLPTTLPDDVVENYAKAYADLPERGEAEDD